jgi:hypothetical protein
MKQHFETTLDSERVSLTWMLGNIPNVAFLWLISALVNCIPALNCGEYLLLCAATVNQF